MKAVQNDNKRASGLIQKVFDGSVAGVARSSEHGGTSILSNKNGSFLEYERFDRILVFNADSFILLKAVSSGVPRTILPINESGGLLRLPVSGLKTTSLPHLF